MSAHQVLNLFLIALTLFLLPAPGLYFMFRKAGIPSWKALVPLYNTWIILELANRAKYWFFLQLIPVLGWFITLAIMIEGVKTFGKFRFYHHALTVLTLGLYFLYAGLDPRTKFVGPAAVRAYKKSTAREWVDAGVFAVVAATLIRTFVFEAYTIPTPSMEKTLLVNDFLFVSKFSYGPRIPNTPLAMPFVHHTLPFTSSRSYVEWIKLPYTRWFPSPVHRNDVVVFNFPAGDTVINKEEFQSLQPYYNVCRALGGGGGIDAGRQIVLADPDQYPLVIRPVDKQENYIKRCVAIAGDTLQIRDQVVYINGKATAFPDNSETKYLVTTAGQPLDETVMKEEYNVDINNLEELEPQSGVPNQYLMLLTQKARDKMLKSGLAKAMLPQMDNSQDVFPYDNIHRWSIDNFGPIWIPKKGALLTLTPENYSMYERAIRVYEGNSLEQKDGRFYINGEPANQYRFKMDYYWMMGDNRHGSQDSRYWGFVPEDHVVGEAWLIWMSWEKGIRWSRLFKRIR
jgi:signal peptidase I